MPAHPNKPTAAWLKLRVNIVPGGCWEWSRGRGKFNYGRVQVRGAGMQAHRVAWTIFNGVIPGGLCVLHKCDNPPCCNPEHLFLGTYRDNVLDCNSKGRGANRNQLSRERLARVTPDQVIEIRRRCLIDGDYQVAVARDYGLCQSAVSRIVTNYNWQNLPMPQQGDIQ